MALKMLWIVSLMQSETKRFELLTLQVNKDLEKFCNEYKRDIKTGIQTTRRNIKFDVNAFRASARSQRKDRL